MKRMNIALFCAALVACVLAVTVFPVDMRTVWDENRTINALAEANAQNVFSGEFAGSVEPWLSDRVGYRADVAAASRALGSLYGVGVPSSTQSDTSSAPLPTSTPEPTPTPTAAPSPSQAEPSAPAASPTPTPMVTPTPSPTPPPAPEVNYMEPVGAGNVKGPLLIFEDRLVELFGYSGRLIDKYSGVINGYREALGDNVRVFSLVTPTQIEFMPEKYKSVSNSEYDAIRRITETLADGVVPVDAYSSIAEHATEYIYFRTDHHWTARGAYYAYRAFADAAGFEPKSLDEYEEFEYPNFLGYLYSLAPSASLKSNPDTIYAYKYRGELETSQPLLQTPGANGKTTYNIFLGGDKPQMTVTTSVKNGRTAVIIKNSYGNAFIPWLAPHYENVVVLDPRSFTGSAVEVIGQYEDVDLIFCSYALILSSENFIDLIAKIK